MESVGFVVIHRKRKRKKMGVAVRPGRDITSRRRWAEPNCSGPPKELQQEGAGSPTGEPHLSGLSPSPLAPGQGEERTPVVIPGGTDHLRRF